MQRLNIAITIDTSALLAVLLGEPSRPGILSATENTRLASAPSLPWEVGNALVAGVRRRRLTPAQVQDAWSSYRLVPIRLVQIDVARALALATSLRVYAYDAYVLETARLERTALLTLDRGMAQAAQRMELPLVEVST